MPPVLLSRADAPEFRTCLDRLSFNLYLRAATLRSIESAAGLIQQRQTACVADSVLSLYVIEEFCVPRLQDRLCRFATGSDDVQLGFRHGFILACWDSYARTKLSIKIFVLPRRP